MKALFRHSLGQSAMAVEHAVAIEVEDLHGRSGVVFEALDEGVNGGGPEEFPGEATGRVLL